MYLTGKLETLGLLEAKSKECPGAHRSTQGCHTLADDEPVFVDIIKLLEKLVFLEVLRNSPS